MKEWTRKIEVTNCENCATTESADKSENYQLCARSGETALYLAYIWGLLYFLLSTFGTLWQEKYHESIVISSLNYLSLAIGLYMGTQIGASLSDKVSLHSIDTHCINHKTRSTGT